MGHEAESIGTVAVLAYLSRGEGLVEGLERRAQKILTRSFDTLPHKGLDEARPMLEQFGFHIGERFDDLFMSVTPPDGWGLQRTDHSSYSHIVDGNGHIRGSLYYKGAFYDREAFFSLRGRYHVDLEVEEGKPVVMGKRTREAWFAPDGREVPKPKKIAMNSYGERFVIDENGDPIDYDYDYNEGRRWGRDLPERRKVSEDVVIDPGTPYEDKLYRYVVKDRMDPDGEPLYATEQGPNKDRRGEERRLECAAWLEENFPDFRDITAYWDEQPTLALPAP